MPVPIALENVVPINNKDRNPQLGKGMGFCSFESSWNLCMSKQ